MFGFCDWTRWVGNPVVVDASTGARLYRVLERAVNDIIDTVYFEENGDRTKLEFRNGLWAWVPDDEMGPHQIRVRHQRISEALIVLGSKGALRLLPRRRDQVRLERFFEWTGIVAYFAAILALLWLAKVGVSA
ncbi:hypothetical protein ROSA5918_23450 [Roseateles saccharophilus]|uniref:Uncharacterized protein n=1 Tax=Roseateles saccharophilus TaxID=304 RepID=A0A4R3UH97_ROSSA|nr:hypothetical protein EV671_104118 [Roseateles saccharophilus]